MHLFRAGLVSFAGGLAISFDLLHLAGFSSNFKQLTASALKEDVLPAVVAKLGLNLETSFLGLIAFVTLAALFRELVYDQNYPKIKIPPLSKEADADVKAAPKPSQRVCLVTGAAGFAGRVLVEELVSQGKYDVIKALDVVLPSHKDPKVVNIKGNILDLPQLLKEFTGVEAVFHVASLISLRNSASTYHRLRLVNVLGCHNVIEACIRRGVGRLIYTSSTATVFDGKKAIFKSEEQARKEARIPNSWYGVTKKEAEDLVLGANGISGLKTLALRPYAIYGEGDNFIIKKTLEGAPMIGSPRPMSFMYVRNLAVWQLCADQGLEGNSSAAGGQPYFVADDEADTRTKDDFNSFIVSALKVNSGVLPPAMLKLLCLVVPFFEWYTNGKYQGDLWELNDATHGFSVQHVHFGIAKGMKDLGYTRKFSDDDIVQNLRKYYKIK